MYRLDKGDYDIGKFTTIINFYETTDKTDELGGVEENLKLDFSIMGYVEYRQGQLYEAYNSIDVTRPLKITLISNGKIGYQHIVKIDNVYYKITSIYLNSNNMLTHIDIKNYKAIA